MFKIFRDMLRYNREFLVGSILTVLVLGYAALHVFAPLPSNALYLLPPDMPPSAEYVFGTTSRGQDVFWQMSEAIWNTATFGFVVTVVSRLLAVATGLASGYLGRLASRSAQETRKAPRSRGVLAALPRSARP